MKKCYRSPAQETVRNLMGMFDELTCRYPLPITGHAGRLFQTKSLDCRMDLFDIRADGTLWTEEYEIEDRSDPNADGINALIWCMTRINKRWRQMTDFTGEIRFCDAIEGDPKTTVKCGWIGFSAYFVRGQIKSVEVVEHREPQYS